MECYIVLDLEWNQSPIGKDGSNEKIPFEIIEIGAVKLDLQLRRISEFHCLVKPSVYREIHYKISEVTHMNMKELNNQGEEFGTACSRFLDWCGQDPVFCTWGVMDLTELQRNMSFYGIPNPFKIPLLYYDVQKLYALQSGVKEKKSLDQIVGELGIEMDRPFHRALDDAFYTAQVIQRMDFESVKSYFSLDYYHVPPSKEEEIYLQFPDYSKYVSRAFPSKEEAILDKTVAEVICYRCRRALRKKIRWFCASQKLYLCLAYCPEHGFVKGRIRMKKTIDGQYYVIKTIRMIGEEEAQLIYKKREEVSKKRNLRNKQKRAEEKRTRQSTDS